MGPMSGNFPPSGVGSAPMAGFPLTPGGVQPTAAIGGPVAPMSPVAPTAPQFQPPLPIPTPGSGPMAPVAPVAPGGVQPLTITVPRR
jgi:hypothetical protein